MKEPQKDIIENYIFSYNSFDTEGMMRDLDDRVLFENISNGEVALKTEGIEEFKKQAESAKQVFSERNQVIESLHYEDNTVTVQIDYRGILATDLPNGIKTGDTLELKGTSVFEFKNGKIIRITDKS